jgi:hypothetical protein
MNYYDKYLKYKKKYLEFKKKSNNINTCIKEDISTNKDIRIIVDEIIKKYTPNDLKCLFCLNLYMKDITGIINEPNLFNLFVNLEELNLSHNQIEGTIDFLSFPSILKKLNLSHNILSGELINIDKLTNIEYLDLSYNYLNFNFNTIIGLQNLIYLDISHNNIDCEITNQFNNFEKLEYLNISNNKIFSNIPEYFTKLSNIKYLNFSNTLIDGVFNQDIFCLSNLEYIDFTIENFDFVEKKTNCLNLIKNNFGSCWNLCIILIFLLGDKTSKRVFEYFNHYKTFENKYNQIFQINDKYILNNIFYNSYVNSIELIKYIPDYKIHPDKIKHLIDIENYDKIDKLVKQYRPKLYLNKLNFNNNIDAITNFLIQIHNRIKFLNIQLNTDKINLIEHISENIEEKTQLLYHEIFPKIGRTEISGGNVNEEFNFCLLLGIIVLNKHVKFEILYNTNLKKNYADYSNLLKIKLHPYNNTQYNYKATYKSCIGIIIHISGHSMCFYECNGIKLFNNCFYNNKTYPFDYEIMFENIDYLNKLGKEFNIYMVSNIQNKNEYFIIKIKKNSQNVIYVIADNKIKKKNNNDNTFYTFETFDSVKTINISDYENKKEVENFIFIQTY